MSTVFDGTSTYSFFSVPYILPSMLTTLSLWVASTWSFSGYLYAEHLSARLLIVQCSQFVFVCMYIRHTLIAWAQFLWSRPQTTSHVILARPSDRKIVCIQEPKWSRGHMVLVRPGGNWCVKKIVWEPKWSRSSPSVIVLESEDGNKGTLHQNRVRQRRKGVTDTRTTLCSLSEIFRRPLCHLHCYISSPAPRTYTLYVVTTDIYLHISGYSSARGILCACLFLVAHTTFFL